MSYVATLSSAPPPNPLSAFSGSPPRGQEPMVPLLLEGFLFIQEGKLGGWKSRRFQLKGDKMTWSKASTSSSILGSIDLASIQNIERKELDKRRSSRDLNKWKFDIVTSNKVYRLAAGSESELFSWMEGLQSSLLQQNARQESGSLGFVLHDAARRGNLAEISKLLISGYPVNQEDRSLQTPLHIAAQEGLLEVVKFLLEKYDAFIGAKDKDDWTPLHSACFNGHLEVCRYLISKGARNVPNQSGTTPLHYLVRFDFPNKAPLCEEILLTLLQDQLDINVRTANGETLLHSASLRGAKTWIGLLIKYGADVNAREKFGEIPLHFAARAGHSSVVMTLVAAGADPTLMGANGTAKDLAARNNHFEVIRVLDSQSVGNRTSMSPMIPVSASPIPILPKKNLPTPPQDIRTSSHGHRIRSESQPTPWVDSGSGSFSPTNNSFSPPAYFSQRPMSERVSMQHVQELQSAIAPGSYSQTPSSPLMAHHIMSNSATSLGSLVREANSQQPQLYGSPGGPSSPLAMYDGRFSTSMTNLSCLSDSDKNGRSSFESQQQLLSGQQQMDLSNAYGSPPIGTNSANQALYEQIVAAASAAAMAAVQQQHQFRTSCSNLQQLMTSPRTQTNVPQAQSPPTSFGPASPPMSIPPPVGPFAPQAGVGVASPPIPSHLTPQQLQQLQQIQLQQQMLQLQAQQLLGGSSSNLLASSPLAHMAPVPSQTSPPQMASPPTSVGSPPPYQAVSMASPPQNHQSPPSSGPTLLQQFQLQQQQQLQGFQLPQVPSTPPIPLSQLAQQTQLHQFYHQQLLPRQTSSQHLVLQPKQL